MKNFHFLILVIISLTMLSNCKEDREPQVKVTPSNFVIEETSSDDCSGLVTFLAAADDAVLFQFYFGDNLSAAHFNTTNGTASHTYQNTGTYNIKVLAYSTDNISISKTISSSIQVNNPAISNVGYSTPESYAGINLVWQDEFNGDQLNLTNWTYETGNNGGWGNNELEYYQAANTTVEGGYLTIKAKKENQGGFSYTSSRMVTKGKKEFKYGRIDVRATLPKGQGIWPALWMLGSNISEVSWPKCGEIDIMELIGGGADRDNRIYGTAHWWDDAGEIHALYGGHKAIAASKTFADEFHVFSVTWEAEKITWYLDDVQYHVIDITPTELNEFQKNLFFIFNIAVGGNWPGSPNASTVFPQRMVVDYIRVFQ